ncbi:hypothetical protein D3C84_1103000 [compost metagenome]
MLLCKVAIFADDLVSQLSSLVNAQLLGFGHGFQVQLLDAKFQAAAEFGGGFLVILDCFAGTPRPCSIFPFAVKGCGKLLDFG